MHNSLLASFDLQPSLIAVEMNGMFEACLARASSILESIEKAEAPAVMADDFWFDASDWRSVYRPYIVKDGILHIPVKGVLLHGFGYQLGSWATGYPYIWKAFERGLADGNVRGIALIIDSPGGHVAGNFDLVDKMFDRRGEKPVRAFAAESAYSAAYSIASAADKIVVSRTGGVGSIGVVTFHVDISKAVDAAGIKITFIHAGKHKVDGNAYEALPEDVKDRIQARIDELYGVFVSTVARNRGMDEKAIRKTEALTFTASQALSNGLADEIGSLEDAVSAFADDVADPDSDSHMITTQPTMGESTSKTTFKKGDKVKVKGSPHKEGHSTGTVEIVSSDTPYGIKFDGTDKVHKWYVGSELEKADSKKNGDHKKMSNPNTEDTISLAAHQTATDKARSEGAAAMQARCKEILGSDEAKGREGMANHLAFSTDMDAAAAVELLKAAPKADAQGKEPNRFEQVMNGTPNPVVGAGGESGQRDPDDVEGIFASAGYAPRKAG